MTILKHTLILAMLAGTLAGCAGGITPGGSFNPSPDGNDNSDDNDLDWAALTPVTSATI